MKKLLLATRNSHKAVEIKHLLAGSEYQILTLNDFPNVPEIIEDQPTLERNALKKAYTAFETTGVLSLADDSGLECYYLELKPGVYSARYAGENATYEDNNKKLLWAMKAVPFRRRHARFRTVIAIVGKGIEKTVEGRVEGDILEAPRGMNGFGYDPLFVPSGQKKTYAEMTLGEKNQISHRAMALKKAVEILKTIS
jgi:XTP/dITP diphosphohydrolase